MVDERRWAKVANYVGQVEAQQVEESEQITPPIYTQLIHIRAWYSMT